MSEPNLESEQPESDGLGNQKRNWSREIGTIFRKNWPKYVAEILVIIVGITSSFMIDNFKEDVKQREEEKFYLRNLLLDLNEDIGKLNELIAKSEKVVEHADHFLRMLRQDRIEQIGEDQFSTHWLGIFYWDNFASSDATFLDLKSGNANFIKDPSLRLTIFDYYTFVGTISKHEAIERDQMIHIIQPYFYSHFAMKGVNSARIIAYPTNHNWKELKSDMFENAIGSRHLHRVWLKNLYQQALDRAKKVKTGLEKRGASDR